MIGNKTVVKYDTKGNEALRTTAYLMAIQANRDNMIDGDIIPFIISKKIKRIKREKEISQREASVTQTYALHRMITRDMKKMKYIEKNNTYPEDDNLRDAKRVLYNPKQDIVYFETTGGLTGGILPDGKIVEALPPKSSPQYMGLTIGNLFHRQNKK